MSIDDIARRLDAAADDLAEMRSDLARHELALDGHGVGARAVADALRRAWSGQIELSGRLATGLTGLSASVRLAANNYRVADGEAT